MGKNAKQMRQKLLREAAEADRPENRVHPKECLLPPDFIQKIRAAQLFIDDYPFFVRTHVATPSGYLVILPAESCGNRGDDFESFYTDAEGNEAKSFMPSVTIWGDGLVWYTEVHQYAPGPGPGDFRHTHGSLDEVYTDVMSYFFDPSDVNFQAMIRARHTQS